MHHQPAAMPIPQDAGPVSPVIGGVWLGDDDPDQSLALQLRLPVSPEELATALYDDHQLCPDDLAKDESVWGFAAVAVIQDRLNAIQRRAGEIALAEIRGTLANPAWLATCRRRVAEVTGTAPQPHSGLASVRALTETASPCHAGAPL